MMLVSRSTAFPAFAVIAVVVAASVPALAQSFVVDQTGSLPAFTISQIDDRNSALESKTGTGIAVFLEHGTPDETEQDAEAKAQAALGQRFSVLVWIQNGLGSGEVIYGAPAIKWVSPDQQDALNRQLQKALQTCCLSDSLPRLVDAIATAMEAGSAIAPDPHHYVLDDLGLLDAAHLATIAGREQQLEASTGKGIGVILLQAPANGSVSDAALKDARSLNVKGDVAAVVWVARNGTSLTFSAVPTAGYADSVSQASFDSINANFQSDMQSGQIGDAIVAAVDRTAAAVAGVATSTPAATAAVSNAEAASAPAQEASAAPASAAALAADAKKRQAWYVVLVVVAIIALAAVVVIAYRRNLFMQ
jgi:uncharacterized membrane protein YgcG